MMVSEVAYWTSRLSTVDMVCTDVEVDFCVGVDDRVGLGGGECGGSVGGAGGGN